MDKKADGLGSKEKKLDGHSALQNLQRLKLSLFSYTPSVPPSLYVSPPVRSSTGWRLQRRWTTPFSAKQR